MKRQMNNIILKTKQ